MLEKCTACGTRILAGSYQYLEHPFCSEGCTERFKIALLLELAPPELIEQRVQAYFAEPCKYCDEDARSDLYHATKITGYIVAYEVESERHVCCVRCARRQRLRAAVHCLAFGWWSIRAAFFNAFVLPTNLIAAALIRPPSMPSLALRTHILSGMANALLPDLIAERFAAEQAAAQPGYASENLPA